MLNAISAEVVRMPTGSNNPLLKCALIRPSACRVALAPLLGSYEVLRAAFEAGAIIKEGPGQIEQYAGRKVCPRPNATLLLIHYLRRTTAYARTLEPKSRTAAGKSADRVNGPPLWGRS